MKKTVLSLLVLLTLCLPADQASSAYLVDTGAGPTSGFAYEFRRQAGEFVFLAGEFTLMQPSIITGIEGWMKVYGGGNYVDFNIYNDGGDIPGTLAFSQNAFVTANTSAAWKGVSGLNWSLGPGTYWVAFEPSQANFLGDMLYPSVTPLQNYALNTWLSSGWVGNDAIDFGVRIDGAAVPLPGALLLLGAGLGRLALYRRRNS